MVGPKRLASFVAKAASDKPASSTMAETALDKNCQTAEIANAIAKTKAVASAAADLAIARTFVGQKREAKQSEQRLAVVARFELD